MEHDHTHVAAALDRFIAELRAGATGWENPTLLAFLEGMRAWLEDSDDGTPRPPSWALFVQLLEAGKGYE